MQSKANSSSSNSSSKAAAASAASSTRHLPGTTGEGGLNSCMNTFESAKKQPFTLSVGHESARQIALLADGSFLHELPLTLTLGYCCFSCCCCTDRRQNWVLYSVRSNDFCLPHHLLPLSAFVSMGPSFFLSFFFPPFFFSSSIAPCLRVCSQASGSDSFGSGTYL